MEDDNGVKAPVTRLRRRLSVELSEESKSPSAPATPTKKRGGRLAAKPQLDLIDENAPHNSPKKTTRKSIVKDIEPTEEKALTPSRRSTRIKSNTSIVSDTQNFDSPRAKRAAARRTSQVGSDSENSLTPATTRTRRTRKDSTSSTGKLAAESSISETSVTPGRATRGTRKNSSSSIDKPVENEPPGKTGIIAEVIMEETETNAKPLTINTELSDDSKNENISPSNLRKSPRLLAKKSRRSNSSKSDSDNLNLVDDSTSTEKSTPSKTAADSKESINDLTPKHEDRTDTKLAESEEISSLSNSNDMKETNVTHKSKIYLNKSTSALDYLNTSKSKRHRTKSWTTLSVPTSEGNFYSDNESSKKKLKKHEKIFNVKVLNESGSGDSMANNDKSYNDSIQIEEENTEVTRKGSQERAKRRSKNSSITENDGLLKEARTSKISNSLNTSDDGTINTSNDSNKENLKNKSNSKSEDKSATNLFQKAPSDIQSMVFIEDSNSNSENVENKGGAKHTDGEDQCVPVVDHQLKEQVDASNEANTGVNKADSFGLLKENLATFSKTNDVLRHENSCEPMDIDETISDNVLLNDISKDNISEKCSDNVDVNKSRKSRDTDNNSVEHANNTRRKSSLSYSISQDLEKTDNENKSTLVLSQIKDVSSTDHSLSKSSKASNTELLSKSVHIPDGLKDDVCKNISLNYLTSTPVQQKNEIKLGIQMNTSVITLKDDGKNSNKNVKNTSENKNKSQTNVSITSKISSSNSSSDESCDENNDLLINEAEDAGDDYESGDSKDEDERQYEEENEILERGETLTSEDDISNESDYEKDSFVVSSDEEDNNLLSGSGDDLNMSDNELTMTAKSKKKYNERSIKQQKKASREMYEARHKLNESDETFKEILKPKKNNRLRIDSTLEEDENMVPPKKNKRMRLDSNWNSSGNEASIEQDNSVIEPETEKNENKKKVKRLQESVSNNSIASEKVTKPTEKNYLDKDTDEIGYKKKKKSKRLSESLCNENERSIYDDNEMGAAHHETVTEEIDPLLIQVKQEPKTPLKDLEISRIYFTDREEIENIEINENVSINRPNETMDPLLVSRAEAEDDNDENDDSISENEEITKNYESVLNNLNIENTSKNIAFGNISLNSSKKTKSKVKIPIIEQLNITDTKKSSHKKKSKHEEPKTHNPKIQKNVCNDVTNEDTSDSIDLKLLFSEDSSDGEKRTEYSKPKSDLNEEYVPLKRTEGKTNILGTLTTNEEENLNFFIDTAGTQMDTTLNLNTSHNTSSKKSKTKTPSQPVKLSVESVLIGGTKVDENESNPKNLVEGEISKSTSISESKTPGSGKKKKKRLSEPTKENSDFAVQDELKHNISLDNNKKQKHTMCDMKLSLKDKAFDIMMTKRIDDKTMTEAGEEVINSKKRKRKSSTKTVDEETTLKDNPQTHIASKILNESLTTSHEKKRKITHNNEDSSVSAASNTEIAQEITHKDNTNAKKAKKSKHCNKIDNSQVTTQVEPEIENKFTKKRKNRDEDDTYTRPKVLKENSLDKIHVPRLPATIVNRLEEKPIKAAFEMKNSKAISTTQFVVEENKKRKNKPSHFLEESVYLNTAFDSPANRKKNTNIKKPKVLPFIPTASTSDSGFTTKFQVNVIPQKIEFVAQQTDVINFKNNYLNNKKVNKLRTYDLYKKHRNVKLTKF